MTSINTASSHDLNEINALIHDCSFDINAIEVEKDVFKLKIAVDKGGTIIKRKFLIFKQFEIKAIEYVLNIYDVKSYDIVDPCKIDIYCFNKIIFDSEKCSFSILCAEPINITVNVKCFKVSLSVTGKIVQTKRKWKISID